MKKILFSLFLLLTGLPLFAQQKCENSYLTMNVPEGWQVMKQNLAGAGMEMITFFNSGVEVYNLGVIIGIENVQDPAFILQNQMNMKANNPLFAEATFGPIHSAPFMGKTTKSVDFQTKVNGVPFKGAAYAFNENGCSMICIGGYKVGQRSNLPQIWRSIRWKHHEADNAYTSLREKVKHYTESMTQLWKQNPIVNAAGAQMISMELEDGEDCLVMTLKATTLDKSLVSEELLTQACNAERANMIMVLKDEAGKNDLTRQCMEEGYVFKYVYLDKNDDFLFTVKVTPDDYNE